MRYLSVCSGIEAASVAWEPLGWAPTAFSEIEKFPSAVLRHHYQEVENLGDMNNYEQWPDMEIDLLCGGTPCQTFSVAGKRKGLDDERGNLTLAFCRIADRYQPNWIVYENVPGILSSEDNAFGCFLAELCGAESPIKPTGGRWTNAGMVDGSKRSAAWRVIDAQYYGIPQRRKRVFVVCGTGGRSPATVLFEPESLPRNSAPSREAGKGFAADVVGSLVASGRGVRRAGESRGQDPVVAVEREAFNVSFSDANGTRKDRPDGGLYVTPANASKPIMTNGQPETLVTSPGVDVYNGEETGEVAATLTKACGGTNTSGAKVLAANSEDIAICLQTTCGDYSRADSFNMVLHEPTSVVHGTQDPLVQEECSFPLGVNQGQENAVIHDAIGFKPGNSAQAHSVGESEELCPTLEGGGGGNNKPAVATRLMVRRLTPRECERLQGFPDDFTRIPYKGKAAEDCPDGVRYKAIGNSWAVPCARWIGERIQTEEDYVNSKK